jgi:NitT/TauT family transport system permease protein
VRLSAQQLSLDRVFALIFYVSLLGLGLFGFVTSLERRLVFWHKSDPLEITSA